MSHFYTPKKAMWRWPIWTACMLQAAGSRQPRRKWLTSRAPQGKGNPRKHHTEVARGVLQSRRDLQAKQKLARLARICRDSPSKEPTSDVLRFSGLVLMCEMSDTSVASSLKEGRATSLVFCSPA